MAATVASANGLGARRSAHSSCLGQGPLPAVISLKLTSASLGFPVLRPVSLAAVMS